MKNNCAKTRKVDNPYHIFRNKALPNWEWRCLKKYQSPDKEKENPYARWLCAVKSPYTYGAWEYGDTYISDIKYGGLSYEITLAEAEELAKNE